MSGSVIAFSLRLAIVTRTLKSSFTLSTRGRTSGVSSNPSRRGSRSTNIAQSLCSRNASGAGTQKDRKMPETGQECVQGSCAVRWQLRPPGFARSRGGAARHLKQSGCCGDDGVVKIKVCRPNGPA
eukprot:scaffold25929_cov200-Isochrysis_galbana.AAC.1